MIDAIRYAKELEETGVPRDQAEKTVTIMSEIISVKLATKDEMTAGFTNARHELAIEAANLRHEMRTEFANIRHEMREMEGRLIIKLAAIQVTTTTLLFGAFAAFIKFVH